MILGIIKSVALHILSCSHRHLLFPRSLWLSLSASLAVALKPSLVLHTPPPFIATSHSLNIDIPFILTVVLWLFQINIWEVFSSIKCVSVFCCYTRNDISLTDLIQHRQWILHNKYLMANCSLGQRFGLVWLPLLSVLGIKNWSQSIIWAEIGGGNSQNHKPAMESRYLYV